MSVSSNCSVSRPFTGSFHSIAQTAVWNPFLCLDEQTSAELRFWKEKVERLIGQKMWFASIGSKSSIL